VVGLDPADTGEDPPLQAALGVGDGHAPLGTLVGVEHDGRDTELLTGLDQRAAEQVVGQVQQAAAIRKPAGHAESLPPAAL